MKFKKFNFEPGDKVSDSYIYLEEDIERSTSNHRYIKVKCTCGSSLSIRVEKSTLDRCCKVCGQVKRRTTFTEKTKESLCKRLYRSYESQAKKRKYSFELDFTEFMILISKNCYYCDDPPSNILKQNYRSITYNGLDRINNDLGYLSGNVVSCCGWCNQMKNKYDMKTFLVKIQSIYNHALKNGDAFTSCNEFRP